MLVAERLYKGPKGESFLLQLFRVAAGFSVHVSLNNEEVYNCSHGVDNVDLLDFMRAQSWLVEAIFESYKWKIDHGTLGDIAGPWHADHPGS